MGQTGEDVDPTSIDPTSIDPAGAVARARARLAALDGLPLRDHVAAYDEVHRLLQDALSTLDEM